MRVANRCIPFLALAMACGPSEEEQAAGFVSVAPTALAFGAVPLEGSASSAFAVRHEGGGPVEVLSVSLVDGDPALWSFQGGDVGTLAAGATAEVTVTFAPQDLGPASGTVQIRTSPEVEGGLFVDLSAEGAESTEDADGDGFSPADGDCDDADAAVNPGATEGCNGRDDDCDGDVPAEEDDADYDGARLCDGDCDDADGAVYPGALEACDDKDTDCVGGVHDRDDLDGDGFTPCDGDCDDAEDGVNPSAAEVCDGLDNDCSLVADDLDVDGDGHGACDPAGDCDDTDEDAHPVYVSAYGSAAGDGTPLSPYADLVTALASLDETCRTIWVGEGVWPIDLAWADGELTLVGGGADASAVELVPAAPYQRHARVDVPGVLTLENLTLTGGASTGDGGAVLVGTGGELVLRGVVARGNTSGADGGAVAASSGTVILEDGCVFEANVAADDGGAIAASSSTLVDRGGTVYVGNAGSQGGAIYASGGALELVDAEVRENAASGEGGGLALSGAGSWLVERARIVLNVAGGAGGGVALRDLSDPGGSFRNNTLQDNVAGTVGGGLAVTGTSAALHVANNTLVANAAPGEGAGIHVAPVSASALRLQGNLIAWSEGLSGVHVADGSNAVVDYNTGYLTSSLVEFAGAVTAGTSDNEARDPYFTAVSPSDGDPDNDDLDLLPGSPEIDSGPPSAAMNDLDGTRNDRGAGGGPGALP